MSREAAEYFSLGRKPEGLECGMVVLSREAAA